MSIQATSNTKSPLNKYVNSVENLRSHHWKYWIDLYSYCQFDCLYCVYREAGAMKDVIPRPGILQSLSEHFKYNRPDGIVYLGPQSDVYQPIEKELGLTREALKLFLNNSVPIFTVTRSGLIRRDLDILKEMASRGLIEVSVTIASTKVIRTVEPKTAKTEIRLKLVKELHREGIPVSVHMAPILPHVDSQEELEELMCRMADAGASCIYGCVLGVTSNYFEALSNALRIENQETWLKFVKIYEVPSDDGVHSANGDYVVDLMTALSRFAASRGIPFSSAHLPILDTCERLGGIFRHKLPTVGDIVREFQRRGVQEVDWDALLRLVQNYPAVDRDYQNSLKNFWMDRSLFRNTYFHHNGQTAVLGATLDQLITNMKVLS
jgi:DNA repair photolyase